MGFKQRGGLNLWLGFWEDSYFLETGGMGSGKDIRDGERCGVPVVSWELEGITSLENKALGKGSWHGAW